jgi:hypothetical protein
VAGVVSVSGVQGWGDNSAGELGNGTLTQAHAPTAAGGLDGITAISAGARFSLALRSDGTVVAWGSGGFGQLGNGSTAGSAVPVPVKGLTGVRAVAAGGGHGLALLSDGTVMAWGDNQFGQLGDGTTAGSVVPVPVRGLTGVRAIAAGELHSLAVLANGTVMTWGDNSNGQLGDGTLKNSAVPVAVGGLTGVKAVSAGGLFSLALLGNGTVRAWGSNIIGQLGDGSRRVFSDVPVAVSQLGGVTQISVGFFHAMALRGSGRVVTWGDNSFGQLGTTSVLGSSHGASAGDRAGRHGDRRGRGQPRPGGPASQHCRAGHGSRGAEHLASGADPQPRRPPASGPVRHRVHRDLSRHRRRRLGGGNQRADQQPVPGLRRALGWHQMDSCQRARASRPADYFPRRPRPQPHRRLGGRAQLRYLGRPAVTDADRALERPGLDRGGQPRPSRGKERI